MSALGHKRTYALQQAMSALPPIATTKATPESGHAVTIKQNDVRLTSVVICRRNVTPLARPAERKAAATDPAWGEIDV
jgi:hypothetical protein